MLIEWWLDPSLAASVLRAAFAFSVYFAGTPLDWSVLEWQRREHRPDWIRMRGNA